jgi:hypothetical protein
MSRSRIFLLSPAHCGGERAKLLFRPEARFELAMKLRTPQGAMIGEVFSFLSGLYFRGKMAYSLRFASPPKDVAGQLVISTNRGLIPAQTYVTLKELEKMGRVPIDVEERRYSAPLEKICARASREDRRLRFRSCSVASRAKSTLTFCSTSSGRSFCFRPTS